MDILHHLIHAFLINVEIHTFPRVQENVTQLVAMSEDILAPPLMEIAASTTQSLGRIGQCQRRSLESLSLLEMILRVVAVDASKEVMVFRIICHRLQLIVATINKSSPNHIASIFLPLAIEREQHLGMVGMRGASSIGITDDELARSQLLVVHVRLVRPSA